MRNSIHKTIYAILLMSMSSALTVCFAHQTKESILISPGDKLHITVFDTPEMEQHPSVTDAGIIPLMLIGDVKVGGMTPAQAAMAIENVLKEKKIMLHPQVAVLLDEHEGGEIYLMGQVKDPGAYDISAPTPIIKALALAGGLTDLADRHITVQHKGDATQKLNYFLSNESEQALEDSITIYPGDVIVVPKAGVVYVLGDVGKPGGFPMSDNNSKITLMQALALAGYANHTAAISGTKLIRRTASGQEEVPVSLAAIQKGKQPDVNLQPNDILYIPFSLARSLMVNGNAIVAAATSSAIYH